MRFYLEISVFVLGCWSLKFAQRTACSVVGGGMREGFDILAPPGHNGWCSHVRKMAFSPFRWRPAGLEL